jgi:hypothetical protein
MAAEEPSYRLGRTPPAVGTVAAPAARAARCAGLQPGTGPPAHQIAGQEPHVDPPSVVHRPIRTTKPQHVARGVAGVSCPEDLVPPTASLAPQLVPGQQAGFPWLGLGQVGTDAAQTSAGLAGHDRG